MDESVLDFAPFEHRLLDLEAQALNRNDFVQQLYAEFSRMSWPDCKPPYVLDAHATWLKAVHYLHTSSVIFMELSKLRQKLYVIKFDFNELLSNPVHHERKTTAKLLYTARGLAEDILKMIARDLNTAEKLYDEVKNVLAHLETVQPPVNN